LPSPIPSVSSFTRADLQALTPSAQSPAERAAFWMRRDIARGVFAPLERLKVEPLTQFYNLGHSPIREAILLLSPSGLVLHEHQKGYRVADVSLADYDDLVEAYRRIYRLCVAMAMEVGDAAWEERVVVTLHRTSKVPKALPDGDPEGREMWQLSYKRMHVEMLSGCNSPVLMTFFCDLGTRLERYLNLFADLESDRARDHHAEHRTLVETLLRRDLDGFLSRFDSFFAANQTVRDSVIAVLRGREASGRRGRRTDSARAPEGINAA
jgi:GntR family carbon starvation induced transcriptional regulator